RRRVSGRAGDRQAHGGADHRGAAREGGRAQRGARRCGADRGRTPRGRLAGGAARARARGPARARLRAAGGRAVAARGRGRERAGADRAGAAARAGGVVTSEAARIQTPYLAALEPRSVFFVDEIHRLPRALEETFYPAMEDHRLPITIGQGAGARVVTLELPPFTLIGATTRTGLLSTPLRDRFGIQARL